LPSSASCHWLPGSTVSGSQSRLPGSKVLVAQEHNLALPSLVLRGAHLPSTASCHWLSGITVGCPGAKLSITRPRATWRPFAFHGFISLVVREHSRLPGSTVSVAREHNLALPSRVLRGAHLPSTASCHWLPGSTVSIARKHSLGCPGSQSRLPGSKVSVAREHSLGCPEHSPGCPGAQSWLPGSTVSVARNHGLGCPGAQSRLPRTQPWLPGSIVSVAREQSRLPGSMRAQFPLLGSTVSVAKVRIDLLGGDPDYGSTSGNAG